MYIMFLDVTHQHSDKKWVPQSRSPIFFFAGLPPRTPPKWQLSLRQPTPDPSFSPFRMMTEAPRADDCYNPPNEMEFKEWTASMGRLTANSDGWENFHLAIRRADGMVLLLYIENFNALLHSQVQQAAQETGLVSESPRTRTLVRPAQHSAHARPPLSMATPNANTFSHPSKLSQLWLSPSASLPTGRVHGQHPQLPHPAGGAPVELQGLLAALRHPSHQQDTRRASPSAASRAGASRRSSRTCVCAKV